MQIKVTFLWAPGSGNNSHGKFYIGAHLGEDSFAVHGANSPNGSGNVTPYSEANLEKKLREKSRAEYSSAAHGTINQAAIKTLLAQIASRVPGADPEKASISDQGISYGATTSARPKARGQAAHFWF